MKKIKYITALLLILCTSILFAQKVEHNGKEYNVKGEKIFMNGVDVTSDLSPLEQNTLKAKLRMKLSNEKKAEALEKEKKKAEKKQKKAEKKQKKAEKELKNKQKAQANYENAQKKLENAQSKYEKLQKKGKLSPDDEVKWLEKIEKLKEKLDKKEKKFKKT